MKIKPILKFKDFFVALSHYLHDNYACFNLKSKHLLYASFKLHIFMKYSKLNKFF